MWGMVSQMEGMELLFRRGLVCVGTCCIRLGWGLYVLENLYIIIGNL